MFYSETVDLSNCPEPWTSWKKELKRDLPIGAIVFSVLTILFFIYFPPPIMLWIFFMLLSIIFIILVIKNYFEKKDSWYIKLLYNHELFNILNKEVKSILESKKIEFHTTTMKLVPMSVSYKSKIATTSTFTIDLMFSVTPKGNTVAGITIKNIASDNLLIVAQIISELAYILNKLNYKEFPEQRY